jgi:hypothetical protein
MNRSRRVVIFSLTGAVILFVGLFFWPYILEAIIKPVALVVWLFLRLFVLSIDQKIYWGVIIFTALVLLFRLLPRSQNNLLSTGSLDLNETIGAIENWRIRFSLTDGNLRDDAIINRELILMLASIYASKQHMQTSYEIVEALRNGQIPLPGHIHTFLFPEGPHPSGPSIKNVLLAIRHAPSEWMRHWTGQAAAEKYRNIEQVLSFMEISLEKKNDQ